MGARYNKLLTKLDSGGQKVNLQWKNNIYPSTDSRSKVERSLQIPYFRVHTSSASACSGDRNKYERFPLYFHHQPRSRPITPCHSHQLSHLFKAASDALFQHVITRFSFQIVSIFTLSRLHHFQTCNFTGFNREKICLRFSRLIIKTHQNFVRASIKGTLLLSRASHSVFFLFYWNTQDQYFQEREYLKKSFSNG